MAMTSSELRPAYWADAMGVTVCCLDTGAGSTEDTSGAGVCRGVETCGVGDDAGAGEGLGVRDTIPSDLSAAAKSISYVTEGQQKAGRLSI